jgi:gliding motility-associated-like protein
MLVKKTASFFIVFLAFASSFAQAPRACTTLGQTPATAFPLCTKDTFVQTTVPICTNRTLVVPGCQTSTASYEDKNPFWYRFTCYQAGTLGLLITPNDLKDDYDWQLYDITGITNLNAVYTDANLFVVGNWSGSFGVTGASPRGTNRVECGSDPTENINTFSTMPLLQLNHTYLLMVSHFSDNQSGYKISFGGGNAVINDPKLPDLQKVKPSCDPTVISLKLDSKMKCNSLAADGSDFLIVPAAATVIAATGAGCSSSFDMDSVTLILSNPLPPGSYHLSIKQGVDANTLLDDCDRDIPAGHQLPFLITPPQPTPLDSIRPLKCAPAQLELVFSKNIRCNSIAADGSDFIVTGPSAVSVIAATASCNNDLSGTIVLKLSAPITRGGSYQVVMRRGTDGNNIIDECGQETPAGDAVVFSLKDTVSADFSYRLQLGCRADTVLLTHDGAQDVNQWLWLAGTAGAYNTQNCQAIFTSFGNKQITLKVSNGFCSDSTVKTIALDNSLEAIFETNAVLCPEDEASFTNTSIGNIVSWNWSFGDGSSSQLQSPLPRRYPVTGTEKDYTVQLVVENSAHCLDTALQSLKVLRTCYIAVPGAFTPNGDGMNDYLYPLNAFKADGLDFNVYNRLGQRVFHSAEWTKKWDGTVNGQVQNAGTYVWTLRYTHHDTGQPVFQKGTSVLVR